MNNTTQKETVISRLKEFGCVDNFWAINNNILRLGAIIHGLTKEGWTFTKREFGEGRNRKNYFYYVDEKPESQTCCVSMRIFGTHGSECLLRNQKPIQEETKQATLL